jgi:NAD(P)-dependent dehydrogenase (short-subunit alcohol dehydrogenase family)
MAERLNQEAEILARTVDVSKESDVAGFFDEIETRFGSPDIVVSNAGSMSSFESIAESQLNSWWSNFVCTIPRVAKTY